VKIYFQFGIDSITPSAYIHFGDAISRNDNLANNRVLVLAAFGGLGNEQIQMQAQHK
jgi:hypothetical protein